MSQLPASAILRPLSKRERQCAYLLVSGYTTNQAIAEHVGLQPDTVKQYISHVFDATGTSDRTELALFIVRYPDMETRLKAEFEQ